MRSVRVHGGRRLVVSEVVEETADARSLVFGVPASDRAAFAYQPGQFLTLRIPSERSGSVARCYSLSSSPHSDVDLKVTVKRTVGGYGSNWLCDNVVVGTEIDVLPPSGTFIPRSLDDDVLLIGAGSGITPVLSILKSVLNNGTGAVDLFYANRDELSVIFAAELRELAAVFVDRLRVTHWLESVQGLPAAPALAAAWEGYASRQAYLCGPAPFMSTVRAALTAVGLSRSQIHAEVFTSLSGDPFAEAERDGDSGAVAGELVASVQVSLDGQEYELDWPSHLTLISLLLEHDIEAPYSCREGECGSCACTVTEGQVSMLKADILDPQDVADGYVLGCQAVPLTRAVKVQF